MVFGINFRQHYNAKLKWRNHMLILIGQGGSVFKSKALRV